MPFSEQQTIELRNAIWTGDEEKIKLLFKNNSMDADTLQEVLMDIYSSSQEYRAKCIIQHMLRIENPGPVETELEILADYILLGAFYKR